jgi:DNA-binding NarL/FixJ family response regulator/tRNA A-37 threonylcarbamoyl transferase component Bud32
VAGAANSDDPAPIRILLVDDHSMVRSGLRLLLGEQDDFRVVGEAGDVDGGLDCTRLHHPDVILLDLNMPGRASLPAIPEFLDAAPGTAVVVMTQHDEPEFARAALVGGATGFVLKEAAHSELVDAVRAAAAGRTYLDPGLGARMIAISPRSSATPGVQVPGVAELRVGSTFAGHRIDAIAGRGGMGVVYRATDMTLDRRVALKLLAPELARDRVFRARFERECRLAAALDHPNVVQIFHAGEEQGALYLTMRYIDGTDLRSVLAEEERLEPARAAAITAQVAAALGEAHRRGLVHRDVKPANVLLATRDDTEQAFLTDFGITTDRAATTSLTRTGFAVGTADYMSPEQARGVGVDARADIYALGCVLYRALTGAVVYDKDSDVEKMWAHIHEPPPALLDLRPELPPSLGDAVERALAKIPADRQHTVDELAHEVLAAVAG